MKPTVLFLCTHNAGRSQMALGFFNALAREQLRWLRADRSDQPDSSRGDGREGHRHHDPATEALDRGQIQAADVVVTMGCGDTCPLFPGRRYDDWQLPDPAGQSVEAVRPIRDEIEGHVRVLLSELGIEAAV